MLAVLQEDLQEEWHFLFKTLCIEIIIIIICIIIRKKLCSSHHWIQKSLLLVEWSFLTFSEVIFHSHAQSSTFLTLLFINGLLYYVIEDPRTECDPKETTLHKKHEYNKLIDTKNDDLKHFLIESLKDSCLEIPRACLVTLSTLPFIHYLSYLFFQPQLSYGHLTFYSTLNENYFLVSFVLEFFGTSLMCIFHNEKKLPKVPKQTLASFIKMASFSVSFLFGISTENIYLNPYTPIIVVLTSKCSSFVSEFFKHSIPSFLGLLLACLFKMYNFSIYDYGELNFNMSNNKNYEHLKYDKERESTDSRHRRYRNYRHQKYEPRYKQKHNSYVYRENSRPSNGEPHYTIRSAIESRKDYERANHSRRIEDKSRSHHKSFYKQKSPSSESDDFRKPYRSRKNYFRSTPRSPSPCSHNGLSSSAERIVSFRELEPFEYKNSSIKQTQKSPSPSRNFFARSNSPNSMPKNDQSYHRKKNNRDYNITPVQNPRDIKNEKSEREYEKMKAREHAEKYLAENYYNNVSEKDKRKYEKTKMRDYIGNENSHKKSAVGDYYLKCPLDPEVLKDNRVLVHPHDFRSPFGKYGVNDKREDIPCSRNTESHFDTCKHRRHLEKKKNMEYKRHRSHSKRQASLSRETHADTPLSNQYRHFDLYDGFKKHNEARDSYENKKPLFYDSKTEMTDFYDKNRTYDYDENFKPDFAYLDAYHTKVKSVTSTTNTTVLKTKTTSKASATEKSHQPPPSPPTYTPPPHPPFTPPPQQVIQQNCLPCGCSFVTNAENDLFVQRMKLNRLKCQLCDFYVCNCSRECC